MLTKLTAVATVAVLAWAAAATVSGWVPGMISVLRQNRHLATCWPVHSASPTCARPPIARPA